MKRGKADQQLNKDYVIEVTDQVNFQDIRPLRCAYDNFDSNKKLEQHKKALNQLLVMFGSSYSSTAERMPHD